jgi:ABC-type sugar transport system ATPase subunit
MYSPLRVIAPKAFGDLDLSAFDIVISSSNAYFAKAVRVPNGVHLCYCHTPPRSLYDTLNSVMKDTPALEVKNVEKTYAGGTHALKGISLTVPEGDFFALLGPNGAGKTTLIGIITSLVNKTGGKVAVFGHDIDSDLEKAKTFIGLVGQEVNFNPFERPIDIVVNQAGYYGIPRTVAIPRAEQLLKDLGLWDKRDKNAMQLSGGMKRNCL